MPVSIYTVKVSDLQKEGIIYKTGANTFLLVFTDSEVLDLLLEEDIDEIKRLHQQQNNTNDSNQKKKKKKKNQTVRSRNDSKSESDRRTRKNSYSDENKVSSL